MQSAHVRRRAQRRDRLLAGRQVESAESSQADELRKSCVRQLSRVAPDARICPRSPEQRCGAGIISNVEPCMLF